MIEIAGDVRRLRPHCKTHKMPAVTKIELSMGITKHKCATFAEAEMLADCGVKDIFLAYNLVGPNIDRAVKFLQKYPDVRFAVTADDPLMIAKLSDAISKAGKTIYVFLDLDPGLHRTGVNPGPQAAELYQQIVDSPGLEPAGFHLYDGQNHQTELAERTVGRQSRLDRGTPMRQTISSGRGWLGSGDRLRRNRFVSSLCRKLNDPADRTCSGNLACLHDSGYGTAFPDMDFKPAVVMLTRVISRPTPDRLTCDLGNKSVASGIHQKGQRVFFPDLPDAQQVLHNEEHLVLQTPKAEQYQPGDELYAIPKHVCPTSAVHKQAHVIEGGKVVEMWDVTARDRFLTIYRTLRKKKKVRQFASLNSLRRTHALTRPVGATRTIHHHCTVAEADRVVRPLCLLSARLRPASWRHRAARPQDTSRPGPIAD